MKASRTGEALPEAGASGAFAGVTSPLDLSLITRGGVEGVENGVESVDPLRVGEVGLLVVVAVVAPDLGMVRSETPWLVATRRMADLASAEVSGRSALISQRTPQVFSR